MSLYDYDHAQRVGLTKAYEYWNENIKPLKFQEFSKLYSEGRAWIKKFLADSAASHSRALYFQKFVEATTGSPNTDLITALNEAYYEGFYSVMKLFPGLDKILSELRNLNYKLGLVTNMQANIQYKKLSLLGIGSVFDCIVTSEAVGHEKPNPLIFSHTLSLMEGTPEKTFMIGDSFKNDVEPAAFIGIKPIWFNPNWDGANPNENIDFQVITNYSELIEKLV